MAVRAVPSGLGKIEPTTSDTLIAYAAKAGSVSFDGSGPNSPFTAALLKHIETPGLEIRQMMSQVRRDVRAATNGRQVPWDTSVLEGDFYMRPRATDPQRQTTEAPKPAADTEVDVTFWKSVESTKDRGELQAYINKFPNGIFAELARTRLLLVAQHESTDISGVFLVILTFWLVVLFASFGLFAPRNATVIATLLISALSVSGAIFLILELDQPFEGLIQISSTPLRSAFAHLGE